MTTVPEPITLAQALAHLRVDAGPDDALISDIISDAREHVEGETGLVLTPRQITEPARQLGAWIDLMSFPVNAVTAIRYPLAGVLTPLDAGSWLISLKTRPVRLLPARYGWGVGASTCAVPALPVEIDISAGYLSPDDVPRRAKRAMLLLITHWYENRGAIEAGSRPISSEIAQGVSLLLRKLKRRTL